MAVAYSIAAVSVLSLISIGSYARIDFSNAPFPPKFVHVPNDPVVYFVTEGSNQPHNDSLANIRKPTLRCKAIGNPSPQYKWYKNGVLLDIKAFNDAITQHPGEGTITFTKVTLEDQGKYVCKASNDNGTAVTDVISLELAYINWFEEADKITTYSVALGDPFSVNCTPPTSNPPARIYWILTAKPGIFNSIVSKYVTANDKGTIYFHSVTLDDVKNEFAYTCTAENQKLKDFKFGNKFTLNVTQLSRRTAGTVPPVEQFVSPSLTVPKLGEVHRLQCSFSGRPVPEPIWKHNGTVISQNDTAYTFESYGKVLRFVVTMESAGKYECIFNRHIGLERNFTVKVEAAPYWEFDEPPDVNTSEDETVSFICGAKGIPPPKFKFFKNGVVIENNTDHLIVDKNKLTILGVKKSTVTGDGGDNAVYQCQAWNRHGHVWANFALRVFSQAPEPESDSGTLSVVKGQNATLKCKFAASPKPVITWESPLLRLIEAEQSTPYNSPNEGILVIKNVAENAAGDYECIAQNKYGKNSSRVTLVVREATKIPVFAQEMVRIVAGNNLELPCKAVHDPQLEVTYEWLINKKPLPEAHLSSGHYRIDDHNTLYVTSPTRYDAAEYECVARTELDEVHRSAVVEVDDVPKPVYQVGVKCNGETNLATVSFTYYEPISFGPPVKEIWAQYRIDNETEDVAAWQTYPTPIFAEGMITIENDQRLVNGDIRIALKPFGKYQFRVFGRNDIGDGKPTVAKKVCETPPKRPDRNPDDVSVEGIDPEHLYVSWKPMPREDWNGKNFHYKVRIKKPTSEKYEETRVENPFTDHVILNVTGKPDEAYDVQVAAVNDLGECQISPSTVEAHSGEGDPRYTPTSFRVVSTGATSVTFAWDPIFPGLVRGTLAGIKIKYRILRDEEEQDAVSKSGRTTRESHARVKRDEKNYRYKRAAVLEDDYDDSARTVLIAPNRTEYTIEGFLPGTNYEAKISVYNRQMSGLPSDPVTFKTEESVPTQVRDLEAFAVNKVSEEKPPEKGVVIVRWSEPSRANGKISGYIVEACRIGDDNGIRRDKCLVVKRPSNELSARLTDLEYAMPYRIIVSGETAAGKGYPSSCDVETLPEEFDARKEPVIPSFGAGAGDTHIDVAARPGKSESTEKRTVGNKFFIEYSPTGANDFKRQEVSGENLKGRIEGLTPGTTYDVRVIAQHTDAMNNVVESISQSTKVRTAGAAPHSAKIWLLLLIILVILLVLCILCIICIAARRRGAKYPVSEKERQQGRVPILPGEKDRGFGEYMKPEDDEKKSLTGGSKAESETDSMAEYGDADPGRFTEDGSFIGQYVPNKTLVSTSTTGKPDRESASTFV